MHKLFRYLKRLFTLLGFKKERNSATWVHFIRKGPNHYVRGTDGQVFTAWQLQQLKKKANKRNELFAVQYGDDVEFPSREEDVTP